MVRMVSMAEGFLDSHGEGEKEENKERECCI